MNKKGIFIAFNVEKAIIESIALDLEKNGFKHLLQGFKPHITMIADNNYIENIELIEFNGYVKPLRFEMLQSNVNKKYFLSLVLESPELQDIHKKYLEKYKFNHPYEEFMPHITFSMNLEKSIGVRIYEEKGLNALIKNMSIELPKAIKIGNAYFEELK